MAKSIQFTAQVFIEATKGSGGIIATIARRVGCDWKTAKKYIDNYPTIRQAYENERSTIDDLAESTVLKAIQEGDVATAKWWLAKKRRLEFGDNLDITTAGQPIEIVVRYAHGTDSNPT